MTKNLRLVFPQWQGGNNPNYAFGSELLVHIAPQSSNSETIHVTVNQAFDKELPEENGVVGETVLFQQMAEVAQILKIKNPDKIIIFGGDCSVSQVPFDFLHGKYGEKLGILWLDAHPDITTPKDNYPNVHAMVLGNLLKEGAPRFAEKVSHPFNTEQIMFAGLKVDNLWSYESSVINRLQLRFATPQALFDNSQPIIDWLIAEKITKLAVHIDLDVLSPVDFRSIYPAEPYLESFAPAIGDLTLKQVVRIFNDIAEVAEVVGLTIAEHLPWDAINLRNALSQISIFND